MYIQNANEYQQALEILEALQEKPSSELSIDEKTTLNQTLKAIESYQFLNDPVSMLATYA